MLEQRRDKVVIQAWDISCGAAALATLLTYDEEDKVTEKEVAKGLLEYTTVEKVRAQLGFSLLDLKRYAESRGYEATGLGEVTLRDLVEIGPAIVPVVLRGYNHFVIFRGIQGDRVLLADPAWGNRTMLAPEFLRIWQSRIAFTVARPHVTPKTHPLMARSKDFWASSAVYQEPGVMEAALAPAPAKAPEKAVMVASVAPGASLSQIAAGASGRRAFTAPTAPAPATPARTDTDNPPRSPPPARKTAEPWQPVALTPPGPTPIRASVPEASRLVARLRLAAADSRVSTPSETPAPAQSRDIVVSLLQRGSALVRLGDISGARRLFLAAAESGNAAAATAMGKTYDPAFVGTLDAIGLIPDLAAAAAWYRKAAEMGDEQGKALLKHIENAPGTSVASGR